MQRSALEPNEVELRVEYRESHKQDLQLQAEGLKIVFRTVLRLGSNVRDHLLGKSVAAFVSNPCDTILRVQESLCVKCEPGIAQSLVHELPDLCRADNAIRNLTGSGVTHYVMLLPTSSSMVQAFTTLSRTYGFKFTIIADKKPSNGASPSPISVLERSDILQTRRPISNLSGPTAVVAHDISSFSQEIWRSIQPGGCFILNENT